MNTLYNYVDLLKLEEQYKKKIESLDLVIDDLDDLCDSEIISEEEKEPLAKLRNDTYRNQLSYRSKLIAVQSAILDFDKKSFTAD